MIPFAGDTQMVMLRELALAVLERLVIRAESLLILHKLLPLQVHILPLDIHIR